MSRLSRKVNYGQSFQQAKEAGIEAAYELAKVSYGPNSNNVAIEINKGFPVVSHDGVTNLRKLNLEDPDANMAARIIVQSSEKNNKVVGDGTTGVAILACNLYADAKILMSSGHNAMQVKRLLETTAREALAEVDSMTVKTTKKLARAVAKVAASDEALGEMVADVIDRIGVSGNPIVEEFDGAGSYDEEVDGFYFARGYSDQSLINNSSSMESRMVDVDIFITEKPLKTTADIKGILDKIYLKAGNGSELLIIGDVQGEAREVLALNKAKGILYTTLVDVPVYGKMRSLFLEDIALYTGGTVFQNGAKASTFEVGMLGGAKQVVVKPWATTIVQGEGEEAAITERVKKLKEDMAETGNLVDREEIRKRIAALTGKVAIIHVGAPTEVDRGEIGLRVEDAICAMQSAIRDGIVPGGGVALARINPTHFKDAFRAPFELLVRNAGYNAEKAAFKALEGKDIWIGYDLKDNDVNLDNPVNLMEAGIIDPAEVVKEEIRNAVSVVGILLTLGAGISFVNREAKFD